MIISVWVTICVTYVHKNKASQALVWAFQNVRDANNWLSCLWLATPKDGTWTMWPTNCQPFACEAVKFSVNNHLLASIKARFFISQWGVSLVLYIPVHLGTPVSVSGGFGPDLWVLRGWYHGQGDVHPTGQGDQGRGAQTVPGHWGHQWAGNTESKERNHKANQGRAS